MQIQIQGNKVNQIINNLTKLSEQSTSDTYRSMENRSIEKSSPAFLPMLHEVHRKARAQSTPHVKMSKRRNNPDDHYTDSDSDAFGLDGTKITSMRTMTTASETKQKSDREREQKNFTHTYTHRKPERQDKRTISTFRENRENTIKFPPIENKNIFTINENQQEEYFSDDELNNKRIEKLKIIKKKNLEKKSVVKEKVVVEDPNFVTKGFKLRQQIIRENGFHSLFRSIIRLNPTDWQENNENEPQFCNYIHIQRTSEKTNISKLPKDTDDLMEYYKNKQSIIQKYVQKNITLSNFKKLERYFTQEITEPAHFKQYQTLFCHLECNREFCQKERLHVNLFGYQKEKGLKMKSCLLPNTFHICHDDPLTNQWDTFKSHASSIKDKVWIVKPGENSNKGKGIEVFDSIAKVENFTRNNDSKHSRWIVQKQIERPLLIGGRKFDIRIQGLITCLHGRMVAYFFKQCQVRTNSVEQTLDDLSDPLIHLSNDAIQVKDKELQGKFEDHNKMSINEFNRTILQPRTNNYNQFQEKLWPRMKTEQTQLMQSLKYKLDPHRRHHGFEILGFDYMLDESLNLYLIEVNNNPALGTFGCKTLENPIFAMRTDTFNLTVNKLFFGYEDANKFNQYEKIQDDEGENGIDREELRRISSKL